MSLLRLSDLRQFEQEDPQQQGPPPLVPAMGIAGTASFRVGRHGIDLVELLPRIVPDHTYQLVTNGHWSLHELIAYIARIIGPADLWLTSWGITSAPLRAILDMQQRGEVDIRAVLFDSRVKLQCPEAYQIALAARKDMRMGLGKNHSKVQVLINDQWGITISSSANLTINPRIEHYTITTHRALAQCNAAWIDAVLDDANPFEAE